MHKLAVAICDPDEEYGKKLSHYLVQTGRLADMVSFSRVSEEIFREKRDLWLVHGSLLPQWQRNASEDESVLCLAEDEMDCALQDVRQIYKYQSADRILQEMYAELSKKSHSIQLRGKEKGKLVLLYQPWYQGIQMLAGFALAQSLMSKGKVLYVNLRGFHGMPLQNEQWKARDITDVLTAIRLESSNMEQRILAAIVSADGLDYLCPVSIPMQIEGTDTEDYIRLIEAIWQYLDYDYVVMEVPPEQEGIRDMFELADRIFCFIQKGYGSKDLVQQLGQIPRIAFRWIPEKLESWYRERPAEELLTDCNRMKEWLMQQGEEEQEIGSADDSAC